MWFVFDQRHFGLRIVVIGNRIIDNYANHFKSTTLKGWNEEFISGYAFNFSRRLTHHGYCLVLFISADSSTFFCIMGWSQFWKRIICILKQHFTEILKKFHERIILKSNKYFVKMQKDEIKMFLQKGFHPIVYCYLLLCNNCRSFPLVCQKKKQQNFRKMFSKLWNFIKITIFWISKDRGKHESNLCNLSRKIHIKLWRFINSMRTFIS